MGYIGENSKFSFRDGFCEPLADTVITSSDMADFGRALAGLFNRITVGCENGNNAYLMYAMSSGIAECGKEVFVCEDTDLPSFTFGLSVTAPDCGIYFSGSTLKLSFFSRNSHFFTDAQLERIMTAGCSVIAERCGKITPVNSLRQLYINSINDSLDGCSIPIKAGISCGSKMIRKLWEEFFSGEDDSLVFQISDDGRHVNSYSAEMGFISHEKLILAYALISLENGGTLYLPDSFHYAASDISSCSNIVVKYYNPQYDIPDEAAAQRFLTDPLFMCTALARDREIFRKALEKLPKFASAKREIALNICSSEPFSKTVFEANGRVNITKSGKNRVTLSAQAYSSETAAELCGIWSEKLRRLSSCNKLFH